MNTILNYHSICDEGCSPISVKCDQFYRQMEYIDKKGKKCVSAEEFFIDSPSDEKIGLTFDDGYRDNYADMLPIVQKFGFSCTIFLTVNHIGTEQSFSWHTRSDKNRHALSWEEVHALMEKGMQMGSHTLNHPILTQIPEKEAWEEISRSKDLLEQKLGVKIRSFAYPAGHFNQAIKEMVEKAGYEFALATKVPNTIAADRFSIPRISINGLDSLPVFTFKLSNLYRYLLKKGLDKYLSRK